MNPTYKVIVNENLSFNLSVEDLQKLDILKNTDSDYHILQDHTSFKAQITASEYFKKQYSVKINNNSFEISIEDPLDLLIDKMGFALGSAKDVSSIEAPMPGLILDISVSEGQEVSEGDPLLILEAMKMENVITSPRNGVVKSVPISQGETVEKKHLLIEFE